MKNRFWYFIHKWTSLICTLFLLLSCLTGLPLIFHEEIESAFSAEQAPIHEDNMEAGPVSLDGVVAKALAQREGDVMQYMYFEDDGAVAIAVTALTPQSPMEEAYIQHIDMETGHLLPTPPQQEGFMHVMTMLHTELMLGVPGKLFLGSMGLLFILSMVSGIVLYGPIMTKFKFGMLRQKRGKRRVLWLDLHNLTGMAAAVWLLVVGISGTFNTLDPVIAEHWRNTELEDMVAPYRATAPTGTLILGSLDRAVKAAMDVSPGMEAATIAWPGTYFSTPYHYNIFLSGMTPATKAILKPALVDAASGILTDTREMPFHIKALFFSQPLHFGDYGGLVLKVVWALFDIIAILVLGSGLYLWYVRYSAEKKAATGKHTQLKGDEV